MVITRIGPISCAKIAGTLYAVMGLVLGGVFSLVSLAGAFGATQETATFPMMNYGVPAIVVFPVLYGCLGFVGALIGAWLYNVLAGWIGGIELDIQ
jgi:uncharacterized membrane protein